jgi:hypothetical protein
VRIIHTSDLNITDKMDQTANEIIGKDYILVGIGTPRRDFSSGVIDHGQKRCTENIFTALTMRAT